MSVSEDAGRASTPITNVSRDLKLTNESYKISAMCHRDACFGRHNSTCEHGFNYLATDTAYIANALAQASEVHC